MFFGYFERCVSAAATKLSSWRCGSKLTKASWHLKINPRIRNYQKHKNSGQALHEDGKKSLKKWRSLAKPRREERKIGPCGFLYFCDRR